MEKSIDRYSKAISLFQGHFSIGYCLLFLLFFSQYHVFQTSLSGQLIFDKGFDNLIIKGFDNINI